jgi:hypothetical protein
MVIRAAVSTQDTWLSESGETGIRERVSESGCRLRERRTDVPPALRLTGAVSLAACVQIRLKRDASHSTIYGWIGQRRSSMEADEKCMVVHGNRRTLEGSSLYQRAPRCLSACWPVRNSEETLVYMTYT